MRRIMSPFSDIVLDKKLSRLSVQPRQAVKLNQPLLNATNTIYMLAPLSRHGARYTLIFKKHDNHISVSTEKVLRNTKRLRNKLAKML